MTTDELRRQVELAERLEATLLRIKKIWADDVPTIDQFEELSKECCAAAEGMERVAKLWVSEDFPAPEFVAELRKELE